MIEKEGGGGFFFGWKKILFSLQEKGLKGEGHLVKERERKEERKSHHELTEGGETKLNREKSFYSSSGNGQGKV